MSRVRVTNTGNAPIHFGKMEGLAPLAPNLSYEFEWSEVENAFRTWVPFIKQGIITVEHIDFQAGDRVAYDAEGKICPWDSPLATGKPGVWTEKPLGNTGMMIGAPSGVEPLYQPEFKREVKPTHIAFSESELDARIQGAPLDHITILRSGCREDMADVEKLLQGMMGEAHKLDMEPVMIDLRPDGVSWDDACDAIVQTVGHSGKLVVVMGIEKMRAGELDGTKDVIPEGMTGKTRLFEQTMVTTEKLLGDQSAIVLVETEPRFLPPGTTSRAAEPCGSVLLSYLSGLTLYIRDGFAEVQKGQRGKGLVIELWTEA